MVTKPTTKAAEVGEEEVISLDMTTAKTFQPLPADRPYLMAVSAWQPVVSGSGGKALKHEWTVIEPQEFANRKVIETLSLENEYTLGRLQNMLIGLGFPKEQVTSKKFVLPKFDDVNGLQSTTRVKIQSSLGYADKNVITKFSPAAVYKEI